LALGPGARLGPYEIVALAGVGGMGEVYRAYDTRLGRIVAIKVIASRHGQHAEMRRRFEDEARLAAQFDHARIGAVYDVGHDGGVDYLVMEFIEGRTIADRIAQGPLPVAELLEHAIEIASGLAYAHRRGVTHRDLKPGNVLLTASGVKIIDFGLAKMRRVERPPADRVAAMDTVPIAVPNLMAVTGTAAYLPPERLQGLPEDHRSDIFAFGVLLYEMASGRRPFDGATPADLAAAILTADPPPLSWVEPRDGRRRLGHQALPAKNTGRALAIDGRRRSGPQADHVIPIDRADGRRTSRSSACIRSRGRRVDRGGRWRRILRARDFDPCRPARSPHRSDRAAAARH
jgi:eukaryotic-like serine/threonine-protein kinase